MEAIQRRRKIFRDELYRDIPILKRLIDNADTAAIRQFAHKYKMRLTYFEEWEALEYCREIVRCYDEGLTDPLLKRAAGLTGSLTGILNHLENESFSS